MIWAALMEVGAPRRDERRRHRLHTAALIDPIRNKGTSVSRIAVEQRRLEVAADGGFQICLGFSGQPCPNLRPGYLRALAIFAM